jgi:hypothetical protein
LRTGSRFVNHPPSAVAKVLADDRVLIPNSVGNRGKLLAGLPRMVRAALLGLDSTNVKFATCVVDRDNLADLASHSLRETRDRGALHRYGERCGVGQFWI